jgi:hypothetical protein
MGKTISNIRKLSKGTFSMTPPHLNQPNVGKILIVDDEKFNCDIIDGFLMILGF